MVGRGRPSGAGVYERLERALVDLNQRLGGPPSPREEQTIWDDIWHRAAHHCNALEGNTLDRATKNQDRTRREEARS